MALQEIRCMCKKLLAKASGSAVIEIACPRCRRLVHIRLEAGVVRFEVRNRGAA